MTYRVTVLARARADVQSTFTWISARSSEGAARWLAAFEAALLRLESNPYIAPLAPENDHVEAEIRHLLFRTPKGRAYRVVFTVVGDEARVLRVRGPGQSPLRASDFPES